MTVVDHQLHPDHQPRYTFALMFTDLRNRKE